MKKQDFIKELSEQLELETVVTIDSSIKDLDEWDSMSAMIIIAYVSDNFNIALNADDIESLTTFNSLIERIGKDKFSE
tara:strand:- start:250 stop:483 length:234 start_codon:yes stop_codon:yes gene_type:complete